MSTSNDKEKLQGWTKAEKYELFQALKSFGSYDIDSIHNMIHAKTPQEIKDAIEYYKNRIVGPAIPTEKQKKRERCDGNNVPRVPLASWAKYLTDNLSYADLETETATALRLIAEFDDIPPAVCTSNVDFKRIYHAMANAVEGKSLMEDSTTALIVDKCIMETALSSRAFIRHSSLKYLIETMDLTDKERNQFSKPTKNNEYNTIRLLALEKSYNPLNITELHLKSSR